MPVFMRRPQLMQYWGIWLPSWCCWLQSNCGIWWDWTLSCIWSQQHCNGPGPTYQASWWSWPSCSWLTPLLWGSQISDGHENLLIESVCYQTVLIVLSYFRKLRYGFSNEEELDNIFILYFQSNLMYGWKLYSYRTLLDAAQTMVSLQLGIFNYEEVGEYNSTVPCLIMTTQWLVIYCTSSSNSLGSKL